MFSEPAQLAAIAGWATLVIGTALVVAPRRASRPLGLEGHDVAVRVIGVSDLVLVPGLLRGSPRWPWMTARAAFNLGDAVYLLGPRAAPREGRERR